MSGQEKTNEYFLLLICEKQICNRNAAEYRRRLFISNSYKGITGGNIAMDMASNRGGVFASTLPADHMCHAPPVRINAATHSDFHQAISRSR